MQSIDFHDRHLDPPDEPEQMHCDTCGAPLVDRWLQHLYQHIPVCGNVECGDCDAYILRDHMAKLHEKETEQ